DLIPIESSNGRHQRQGPWRRLLYTHRCIFQTAPRLIQYALRQSAFSILGDNRMLSRRATLLSLASLSLAAGGTVEAQSTPLPISIGTQADSHWLTLEAQKKGLFDKVGLKATFVKFTAGAPMMAAAQSKSIDVATVGLVPFLAGVGQGIPWVAIGFHVAGPKGEGILARKGAGIRSLADLKGKRIGFFRASTAHYGLFMALKKGGVAPDQVTLLSMAPAQQLAAMRAGEID